MAATQSSFPCVGKINKLRSLIMNVFIVFAASLLVACGGAQTTKQTESQASSASKDADRSSGDDRSPSGAKALMLNASSSDSCSNPEGDKTDWWYMDIPGQGKLILTLNIESAGNDLNLILYDNAGTTLASSRGGESVVKEVIEKDVSEGRYYVRVYTVNETDKSDYELHNIFNQEDGIAIPTSPYEEERYNQDIDADTPLRPVRTDDLNTEPLTKQPGEEPEQQEVQELPVIASLEYDQGIEIRQITPEISKDLDISEWMGLVIVRVEDGSPAKAAGFRRGDVILAIDEKPLKKLNMFAHKIKKYQDGDTILFLIKRGIDTLYMILKVKNPSSGRYS